MSDRDARARSIQDAIRQILVSEWAPIGGAGDQTVTDEYDAYIGGVYHLVARHASPREIAEYLASVEKHEMGLGPAKPGALMPVATRLATLDVRL